MSNNQMTPEGKASTFARSTGEVWVGLLKITHANLIDPIRVTTNDENLNHLEAIIFGGDAASHEYISFPFVMNRPDDRDDEVPVVEVTFDNINREITDALRALPSKPECQLKIIMCSQPDSVQAGPYDFSLQDVQADDFTVTGSLGYESVLDETYPADSYDPDKFPGLFQ